MSARFLGPKRVAWLRYEQRRPPVAPGQLILRTQHDFPPAIAVTLAAETMLAVTRMAPLAEVVEA